MLISLLRCSLIDLGSILSICFLHAGKQTKIIVCDNWLLSADAAEREQARKISLNHSKVNSPTFKRCRHRKGFFFVLCVVAVQCFEFSDIFHQSFYIIF